MSDSTNPLKQAEDFFNGKGEIIITPNGPIRSDEPSDEVQDDGSQQDPVIGQDDSSSNQQQQDDSSDSSDSSEPSPFDFSKYGVQSEEELASRIARLQELESKAKEFEMFDQIKGRITAPYADENIAKINSVIRDTGIKDLNLAAEIATLTPEQLRTDPAKALAIREVMKNPDALSALTFDEVKQAMAKKYDIEYSDELAPLTKLEVETAIKEVQNKVSSIKTSENDVLGNLLREREQELFLQQQKSEKAAKDVEVAVSKYSTLKAKFGGEEISVAVSPDLLDQVKGWASHFAANLPENESYQSTIDNYITGVLKTALEDKIAEQFKAKIEGKIRKEAVKQTHNGGSVTHRDKPGDSDSNWIPEWQQAHIDYLKKMGMSVPK
jgi:hypothetical protein